MTTEGHLDTDGCKKTLQKWCGFAVTRKLKSSQKSGHLNSMGGWNSTSNEVGRRVHRDTWKGTQTKHCLSPWFVCFEQ